MLKVLEYDEQDMLEAIDSELRNLNMTDLNADQQIVVQLFREQLMLAKPGPFGINPGIRCRYSAERMFTTDARKAVHLISTNSSTTITGIIERYCKRGVTYICPC